MFERPAASQLPRQHWHAPTGPPLTTTPSSQSLDWTFALVHAPTIIQRISNPHMTLTIER